MLELGFVSAILPELDLEQNLLLAQEIGYTCVEVMCWPVSKAERRYAGVTHIDLATLDESKMLEIERIVNATGVRISALGYYPNCLSPDAEEARTAVAHLMKLIEAAKKLQIDCVTTFIGRNPNLSVDDNWPQVVATWRPIVDHAAHLGVRIGIENCPMFYTNDEWPGGKNIAISPAVWQRLFDVFPTSLMGLNYDPSHLVWQQMDYLEPIRNFVDRFHHVHAKDVRVDRERLNQHGILANPGLYHTPKLPGLGDVQWGQFFSTLVDAGYRGPVCVEVEDRAYEDSLESRKQALRQSFRFLKNFMP